MKNLMMWLLLPVMLSAQYWGERTTEQSFEQSELYFTSHFLNTFGIYRYKDVAPGLINDPFLNLYINPANIPSFDEKEMMIYLDFRGDRTEEPILDVGINPVGDKIVGDVEFESAEKKASYITPVPGGVGPVTVVMLMRNGIEAYKIQNGCHSRE